MIPPLRIKEELRAILFGQRGEEYLWVTTQAVVYPYYSTVYFRVRDNTFWKITWKTTDKTVVEPVFVVEVEPVEVATVDFKEKGKAYYAND